MSYSYLANMPRFNIDPVKVLQELQKEVIKMAIQKEPEMLVIHDCVVKQDLVIIAEKELVYFTIGKDFSFRIPLKAFVDMTEFVKSQVKE